MDKIDTNNNELNTEIIPEIKRVTLHPLTAEGETDLEVNLYPKTLLDGIVDREGNAVEVQEKLISGETIKTINGESVLGDGNIETVDAYTKEESDEKFLSKEAAAETYETIVDADEKFAKKEEIPTNYVTTDTRQVITGEKEFNNSTSFNGEVTFNYDVSEQCLWIGTSDGTEPIVKLYSQGEQIALQHISFIDHCPTFNHGLGISSHKGWPWDYPAKASYDGLEIKHNQETDSFEFICNSSDDNGNITSELSFSIKENTGKITFNNKLEVPDTSDWESNKTIATENYVDNSVRGVSDSLAADIAAEGARALAAEQALSLQDTQYFSKFVTGDNIDTQVDYGETVYCDSGSMLVGGEVPSTVVINFTQAAKAKKAVYLKSIYIKYRDKEEIEQEYSYTFTNKQFNDLNTAVNLGGLNWIAQDPNSNLYLGYSNSYGQQFGSSSQWLTDFTLTTSDLAGCFIEEITITACGASSTAAKLLVEAGADQWLYHEGQEDESTQKSLLPNTTTDAITFTYGGGSEIGEGHTVTFTETFLTKKEDSGEPNDIVEITPRENILYVNNENNIIHRFNGTTLEAISKTLELGTTSSTAYRGDYGQQNYNELNSLKGRTTALEKAVAAITKPKSKTVKIETTAWTNNAYTLDLAPVVVGANDILFVYPDDSSAESYYDSGITKTVDAAGTQLTLTAATLPVSPITVQLVYIACDEWGTANVNK